MVSCKKCGSPFSESLVNTGSFVFCPACTVPFMVRVYPAASTAASVAQVPDAARDEAQAGCFYHPGRPAEVVCAGCGRFICALCEVELRNRHFCPACVRQRMEKEDTAEMVRGHVRFDKIAFYLAIVPLFFWPVTLFTGPAAVIMGIRYWNRPVSLVTSGRTRLTAAFLVGGLQVVGWLSLVVIILAGILK